MRMPKESCPKMDATRKKEARTTKDNMAKDSNDSSRGARLRPQQKTGPCGGTL